MCLSLTSSTIRYDGGHQQFAQAVSGKVVLVYSIFCIINFFLPEALSKIY